jgi:hypothetical protein
MKKFLGWGAAIFGVLTIIGAVSSSGTNTNSVVPSAALEFSASQEAKSKPAESAPSTPLQTQQVSPVATLTPAPQPKSNCDPNYNPCVPNVSYDLDCADIGFSVTVVGSDPHRFDRDGDGYGCESY